MLRVLAKPADVCTFYQEYLRPCFYYDLNTDTY